MSIPRALIALLPVITLTACDRYRVTVNELAVYEPAPLFSDFRVPDKGLFDCLQQTIEDQGITAAAQLILLQCSHAGIQSLQGLERFDHLQTVNLRNNAIRDLSPMQQLPKLKTIDLASNHIRSVAPLLGLPNVVTINLENNAELDCNEASALAQLVDNTTLPARCKPGVK
jgi:hypothetical protein